MASVGQQGKPHRSRSRARQYEGLTVWFNSLVASAGGKILDGPGKRRRSAQPAVRRPRDHAQPGHARRPPTRRCRSAEGGPGPARPSRPGNAAFEVNYPFVYPSAKDERPRRSSRTSAGRRTRASTPASRAKVTIGGINLGVGGYTKHPDAGVRRRRLPAQPEQPEARRAIKGGLPPTLTRSTTTRSSTKRYPFAALIRDQLDDAARAARRRPAYADVSLGDLHDPVARPSDIDPTSVDQKLRDQIDDALKSKGLC